MPVSPKSQKKSGAPKAKGAVRAKSGCYTCRIRRKKCDEQSNEDGHCQTCVRLRLECLGFGAKRPDWLRDNRNVLELREKIKGHLAAQGMIKGHSGSGPRNAEHEPPVLRLHEDYTSSSTASPPTPTLSIDESRPHAITSSIRDDTYIGIDSSYGSSVLLPQVQELSPDSPRGQLFATDVMLPPYQPHIPISSSHNLVASSGWSTNTLSLRPAIESSFGALYHRMPSEEVEYADSVLSTGDSYGTMLPFFTPELYHSRSDQLVIHYMSQVVEIQYLLADQTVRNIIQKTIDSSRTARQAVQLLSTVHRTRMAHRSIANDDYNSQYSDICQALSVNKEFPSEYDAMAGLHVVSAFLFNGGVGQWRLFIDVACRFSYLALHNRSYRGPSDVLSRCDDMARFIIKTTMWFDILAAASQRQEPYFMPEYRTLFDPAGAFIDGALPIPPKELCMLPIMGCENHIVWALAEISHLACWRDNQTKRCSLSMPDLINRGRRIEKYLLIPSQREDGSRSFSNHQDLVTSEIRHLTSEIFRASARVYLHSVLSGDYPSCPEIIQGVRDTIECLKKATPGRNYRLTTNKRVPRSVVRSVVFSIFICGCLTDDPAQREFLRDCLIAEEPESVGNCAEVLGLMENIWSQRSPRSKEPVHWQKALRESQLLLV